MICTNVKDDVTFRSNVYLPEFQLFDWEGFPAFFSNNEYNKVGDALSPPHTRWFCVYLDAVRTERRVDSDRWC